LTGASEGVAPDFWPAGALAFVGLAAGLGDGDVVGAVLLAGRAAGFLTTPGLATCFAATGLLAGVAFFTADLAVAFLATALLEVGLLEAGFFAAGFFATGFFAAGFLAATFLATGFFAGTALFAAGFFFTVFFTAGFLATAFLAAGFLLAGFLPAGFLAATFFAAGLTIFLMALTAFLMSFLTATGGLSFCSLVTGKRAVIPCPDTCGNRIELNHAGFTGLAEPFVNQARIERTVWMSLAIRWGESDPVPDPQRR